ncbi:hypothetical protein GH714_018804 [Hevea brasiliensis]|uniref:Uncharacterized protein n=1 Tax=Hevea brasiliensis TaxID=3981 RepID=A0A6A6MCH2_HEVBR|nr:hypothetical protein GH714_018804 [Hevea brasiliensis]
MHLNLCSLLFVTEDGHAEDPKQSTADMTAFPLLSFHIASAGAKSTSANVSLCRIDELEQSVNDLRSEMGVEGSPSPSAPPKVKEDPKSGTDSTSV